MEKITLICTFIIGHSLFNVQANVQVNYLGQFRRTDNTGCTDVYFCCNANGSFLHWQYGSAQLRAFFRGEVGRTYLGVDNSFNYTTSLLSSRPLADGVGDTLDSVLILTFEGTLPTTFQVTCTSNLGYSTNVTTVSNSTSTAKASSGTASHVLLEYLFPNPIVGIRSNTFAFVCEASNDQQLVNADGSLLGFTRHDEVGEHKTLLSEDRNTADVQSILIFRDISKTTSIIFIPQDSDVHVICYYGDYNATISTDNINAPTKMPPNDNTAIEESIHTTSEAVHTGENEATPPLLTTEGFHASEIWTTMASADGTLDDASSAIVKKHLVIPIVIVSSLVILLVVVIGIVILLQQFRKHYRNSKFNISDEQPEAAKPSTTAATTAAATTTLTFAISWFWKSKSSTISKPAVVMADLRKLISIRLQQVEFSLSLKTEPKPLYRVCEEEENDSRMYFYAMTAREKENGNSHQAQNGGSQQTELVAGNFCRKAYVNEDAKTFNTPQRAIISGSCFLTSDEVIGDSTVRKRKNIK